MNIPSISPLLSNGSAKQQIHYWTNCYLSPFKTDTDTVTSTTTYNGHTYHLLDRKRADSSVFSTALKVISYCTIILPVLAVIARYATKDRSGSYFLKRDYTYQELKKDLRSGSDTLKALHQLMPGIFYYQRVSKLPEQENAIEGALGHADVKAIKVMTALDSEILYKADFSVLKRAWEHFSDGDDLLCSTYIQRKFA